MMGCRNAFRLPVPQEGGHAAACVEHMIREYRTLFVARKRAIVPPTLPAAAPVPRAAASAITEAAPALVAAAVIEDAAVPSAVDSGRTLAPLKVSACSPVECASPSNSTTPGSGSQTAVQHGGGVVAHSLDDLPDSPMADAEEDADPGLEAAVADLLFSST